MTHKKIVITGANGFVGSRLVLYYQEKYDVIGFTHKQLDITKYEEVEKKIEEITPEIIIHCGAISDVGACEQDEELSFCVNVAGTSNLAKIAGRNKIRLVFCSSDQVYVGQKDMVPHIENIPLYPPHIYGKQM